MSQASPLPKWTPLPTTFLKHLEFKGKQFSLLGYACRIETECSWIIIIKGDQLTLIRKYFDLRIKTIFGPR